MTTTITSDWRAIYERRLMSAQDAAARVKSGDQVYLPTGQQVHAIVRALVERAGSLRDVTVTCIQAADYGWFGPEFEGRIRANILYTNLFNREAVAQGKADYTPFMIYGHHKGLDEGRAEGRRIDVNVISVTPPTGQGYISLGHAVWDAKSSVKRAAQTIAVVNEHLPRTFGDSWLHVSEIDAFVEDHTPIPDITARAYPDPEPWDAAIAGYVSSLVNDGDTIQVGTGSSTGNLNRLGAFDNKHDLGMFAELTVPGTIDLVRRGVINGRRMSTHPGKFVAATAGNSNEDRGFMNENPAFELHPVEYVLNPRSIAANDNYKAINNAIAADLTGQIAASTIGPAIYSGTGGHFSFAVGAYMSCGGRYICVLPSTARNGTVSRIVPHFEPGQVVTVPREIADTVVTEYGIARLLNRSVRERAEALIAVAHPDFRAELRKAARKLYWGEG